jgi:hypothetical protein
MKQARLAAVEQRGAGYETSPALASRDSGLANPTLRAYRQSEAPSNLPCAA